MLKLRMTRKICIIMTLFAIAVEINAGPACSSLRNNNDAIIASTHQEIAPAQVQPQQQIILPVQHRVMKLREINSLQDVAQYEAQCYQHDYYTFHPHDLDPALASASHANDAATANNAVATAPIKKSLYSQIDSIPLELQDIITGYLKKTQLSDENDPIFHRKVMIDDIIWKAEHEQQFKNAVQSWQPKDLPFIKDCLRTEYWLRYVARARNLHQRTENGQLIPSPICATDSCWNQILPKPCSKIYPGHDLEIAMLMITCGALVNRAKYCRYTPLYDAVKNDFVPIIKLLIKFGLNQTHESTSDLQLITPLHVAAEKNSLDALRYLHSIGCDINAQEHNGYTPLHRAYYYEHNQVVQLLLSLGANPNIKDHYGLLYNQANTRSQTSRYYSGSGSLQCRASRF